MESQLCVCACGMFRLIFQLDTSARSLDRIKRIWARNKVHQTRRGEWMAANVRVLCQTSVKFEFLRRKTTCTCLLDSHTQTHKKICYHHIIINDMQIKFHAVIPYFSIDNLLIGMIWMHFFLGILCKYCFA